MSNQTNWVVLGRFGRPHGIKGFVSIHTFTEVPENILKYGTLYAQFNNAWQAIELLAVETRPKCIIAQVQGYPDRDAAAMLTNKDIAVPEASLPDLESSEFYWHQLIGMQVFNEQGQLFGQVTDLLRTGANDVLIVQGDKKHLIPYVLDRYIKEINSVHKKITVDWDLDF